MRGERRLSFLGSTFLNFTQGWMDWSRYNSRFTFNLVKLTQILIVYEQLAKGDYTCPYSKACPCPWAFPMKCASNLYLVAAAACGRTEKEKYDDESVTSLHSFKELYTNRYCYISANIHCLNNTHTHTHTHIRIKRGDQIADKQTSVLSTHYVYLFSNIYTMNKF